MIDSAHLAEVERRLENNSTSPYAWRGAVESVMPELSRHFHLMPWDIPNLRYTELAQYLAGLRQRCCREEGQG